MKKITIIVLTCCTFFFGALAYILWWPIPSCSEYDFETAMHVSSDLIDVPIKQVAKYPIYDMTDISNLMGYRSQYRYGLFPIKKRRLGIGPIDPKQCRYELETTNSQVRVLAIVRKENVVWVQIESHGDEHLGKTMFSILKKWVPTTKLPIKTVTSKIPLWDKEKK